MQARSFNAGVIILLFEIEVPKQGLSDEEDPVPVLLKI
jgi:hypothetical protein